MYCAERKKYSYYTITSKGFVKMFKYKSIKNICLKQITEIVSSGPVIFVFLYCFTSKVRFRWKP